LLVYTHPIVPTGMADFSQYIIPIPVPDVEEIFQVYQVTHAAYREIEQREAFEQHCQWYYQVAEQHRQELTDMQSDVDLLGWFYRSDRR
jgi:hypothetical protein